ncbi:MAG TPA: Ig-like domain-containing protein [Acidimicrobiia bacterium]|nr:Ig-like domain-containing protein [Acidimicrobiia bacterium]
MGRTRLMVLVSATGMLTGLLPGVMVAAAESLPSETSLVAREVRTVDAKDFGASKPTGLAYDSRRGDFLVASPRSGGAIVHLVDRLWEPVSESSIAGIADASTLGFDSGRDLVTWAQSGRVFGVPGQSLRSNRSIDAATAAEVGEDTDLERATSRTLSASNESDGLVYVLDVDAETLETFDDSGEPVEIYDLVGMTLRSPESMTFAPSTDATDDPDTLNLFVADSGDATWDGGVTEITLEQPMILAAETVTASLVQVVQTSAWNPPSSDPSGIVWNPSNDQLIVVDSEINEIPLFQGVNMWHINRAGAVLSTGATWGPQSAGSYSDEPTGLGYDNASNTLFVSDDTGTRAVYVVKPGPDGQFGTTDDIISTISNFGLSDTEDPEFDPVSGHLFILGGTDREVYRVDPVDGIFGNSNDIISSFDISHLGPTDFEGMTSSVSRQSLFIGSRNTDQIFEVTHQGELIRTIDVGGISGLRFVSGLAMAPRSTDSSVMSLWIVDRGIDEDNDGVLYEIAVPDLDGPGSNRPPVVDAGPDQSVEFPDAVTLNGQVNDDGNPDGVLTITWSKASGPGDVVFANPAAASTTATFSQAGIYVLELLASDGEFTSTDTALITVTAPPNSPPTIEPIADVTVAEGQSAVVPISASDPDGDELSIVVEDLPAFASFNETIREITISPDAGDAGAYGPVTVTVSDGAPGGGQAPQLRSAASAAVTSAGGSTITVSRPAGLEPGDLLIAQVRYRDAATGAANLTAPPGWNHLGTIADGSANHTVLYKIAGQSEPTAYTFDQNADAGRMSAGIGAYVGADPVQPIHAWAPSFSRLTALTAPSVHSTIGGTTVLRLWGWRGSQATDAGVGFNVPPPGVTQLWSQQVGHSNDDRNRVLAGGHELVAAGATGTATASGSTSTVENRRSAFTLVLAPAATGSAVSTTFDITVTAGEPQNSAPVAADDAVSTGFGSAVTVVVLANDSDPDGDVLSVTDVSDPAGGSVVVNADQSVTYTPDVGFSGVDTFTYRAFDGVLSSNVATVTVTVAPDPTSRTQHVIAQSTTYGSVSGTLDSLHSSDDTYQQLTEEHTGGPPPRRMSRLEHTWTFQIERGETITFHLEARRTSNSEGDDFAFTYSVDGGATFQPLVTVASASDTTYQVALPNTISGTVIVRVVDTDRTTGFGATDSLFVDRMVIVTDDVLPPLPTVTVSATQAQASEDGAEGQFTITRDDSSGSLTVYYSVSGTATPGDDYEPLLGLVLFANGQSTAVVQVVPIDDGLVEGSESVVLSLVADAAYQVGAPAEAGVIILDNDLAAADIDASSQTTVMGTVVSGNLASTFIDDGIYLQIREESWAGGKRSRLEHRWTFDVTAAGASTFFLQAHRTSNEAFVFSYSLNGSTWIDMFSVNALADPAGYQAFALPSNVTGVIHIRVVDADRSSVEPTLDSIFVDDMFIRLEP